MQSIKRSYQYYYTLIPIKDLKGVGFTDLNCSCYIFSHKHSLPDQIQQGMVDILPNRRGIVFTSHVIEQFSVDELLMNLDNCYAFYLHAEIDGPEESRYNKNYSFDIDLEKLMREVPDDDLLKHEESAWKDIFKIDPDIFLLKKDDHLIIGAKDQNQIIKFSSYGVANKV